MNRRVGAVLVAAAAGTWAACTDFGGTHVEAPAPGARFDTDIQPIFTQSCAISGCHAPPVREQLDLRPGSAYDHIVGVPSLQRPALQRIHPGLPDSSYLLLKLSDCACFAGLRMPAGGPMLPAADRQRLRDWTLAGAPR